MSKLNQVIFAVFFAFLFLSCSHTSHIGKLYSMEEANQLFGPAIFSVEINSETLRNLMLKTDKNIMFGLINKQLIILDNKRRLLYPDQTEFKETDVFTVYSISLLNELLSDRKINKQSSDGTDIVNIEQRREVLSISSDTRTLESGLKCPPLCTE